MERIKLEALLLDRNILERDAFRQWEYNYTQLNFYTSPEPNAYDRQYQPKGTGIYLRFILPRELRTRAEGETDFPFIPNRWLITRVVEGGVGAERETVSWVLESDCPVSPAMKDVPELLKQASHASQYIVPSGVLDEWKENGGNYRSQPRIFGKTDGGAVVKMGIRFPAGEWKERSKAPLVVRSCAPGNPMFSAYTPHNSNILSVYDALEDVREGTVSYTVCGWYSAGEPDRYYAGNITGIPWSAAGVETSSYQDPLKRLETDPSLKAVAGESVFDALCAYTRSELAAGMPEEEWHNMEVQMTALQRHMAEDLKTVDGVIRISNAAFENQFIAQSSGRKYRITAAADTPAELEPGEQDLLQRLDEFEENVQTLKKLRQRVLELWWKRGHLEKMPVKSVAVETADFDAALDAGRDGSLMSALVRQYRLVREQYREIFLKDWHLPEGHTLKTVPAARYWRKKNPVVLIEGVDASADMELNWEKDRYSPSDESAGVELPSWSGNLPETIARLYQDQLWTLQQGKGEVWEQPWHPMFLEWRVACENHSSWEHIRKNWQFDGTAYQPQMQGPPGEKWTYGGIAILNQANTVYTADVLREQLQMLPDGQREQLRPVLDKLSGKRLLGQELTGFRELMAQQDYRSFRQPYRERVSGCDETLDELLGFSGEDARFMELTGGGADYVPYMQGENIPDFCEFQAGIGHICDLSLYDAFGRVLHIICSEARSGLKRDQDFSLIVSEHMQIPNKKNLFYIPPSLSQAARLMMHFPTENGRNPVAGFFVPSMLDGSIHVYRRDGAYGGEISVRADGSGIRRVCFLEQTGQALVDGILKKIVEGITSYGTDTVRFADLLDSLDKTFWMMNPLGSAASSRVRMIGRPLAVVELDLWIEPEKEWRHDIGWSDTGQDIPPSDIFRQGTIPLRLGDAQVRRNGVSGYFIKDKYDIFHSVNSPDFIQIPFGEERKAGVIVLAEPSGFISGYTGIFPMKEITIPEEYTAKAMKTMLPGFRVSAYLTAMDADSIRMPNIEIEGGDLRWVECAEGQKAVIPVRTADDSMVLNGMELSVRDGFLQMVPKK